MNSDSSIMIDMHTASLRFNRVATGGCIEVIKQFDCVIHKGEFVSLVGPSGCGKSTAGGVCFPGALAPDAGSIHFPEGKPRLGSAVLRPMLSSRGVACGLTWLRAGN